MSRAVATAEASGKGVVAVTGASGFIGSFICEALSNAGYLVRACVRDPTNEEKVAHLKKIHGLQLFKADLFDEGSFRAAFDGADAVIHTAAVVEIAKVKNAQREVVDPSVLGVKNVLKSLSPSVRTFVHTSSIAAVHRRQSDQLLTETDWNDWATIENDPYGFAKTEAEKLVWEWEKSHPRVRVRIINPTVVLGPVQCKAHTKSSTVFLRQAVYGNKVAPFIASYVDVRDVAAAHIRALELGDPSIHRFIVSSDAEAFRATEIGEIAQRQLPQYVLKTPPLYSNWLVLLLVLLSYIPFLGSFVLSPLERSALTWKEKISNKKAKSVLGMRFRPIEETIKEGVESIIAQKFVVPKKK